MNRWREEDFLFHQQHATLVAGDRKPIWWKKHYDLLGLKQTVFKNQVRSVLSRISFKKPSFYCQIREEQSKSKRKMEGRCAHWSEAGKALSWPRDWGHRWAQLGGEGVCPYLPAFKGRTESEGDDSVVTSETGFPPIYFSHVKKPILPVSQNVSQSRTLRALLRDILLGARWCRAVNQKRKQKPPQHLRTDAWGGYVRSVQIAKETLRSIFI